MAGLLTHLGVSLALMIIVMIVSRKWLYGISIFIGQIIPDAIKFGITGIKLRTFSPVMILRDKLFWKLEAFGSDYHTWVIIGLFVIFSSFFLYYIKRLKKEQVKEINWAYLLFVIGVAVHLIIDIFIIEHNYWI
ncbi:MAG: hypothetical protein PHH54_01065 [Candidatus Nanoarchaeia archaeon]|nr:hypothetical protein [Candidatus Nanoarchaeia archaeon]MDD5740554.1 hypothetical protein [Candidatus Nanoarchaeia archaeon]